MKKIALTLAATLFLTASLMAHNVDTPTAQAVAMNFWNTYRPARTAMVSHLTVTDNSDLPHLHIFVGDSIGFVITSADDRVRPILAYSFDSPFPKELHEGLRYWLEGYEQQIAAWGDEEALPHPVWKQLLTADVPPTPVSITFVPTLISSHWTQSKPFNNLCPWDDEEGDRTVVGCVATAMAQIMNYWEHPSCGTGSHTYTHTPLMGSNSYGTLSADFAHTTYMWEDMPNNIQFPDATPERQTKALSTLCYHVGVSVDMMYGTHSQGGSGAYTSCGWWADYCAENAFRNFFKYDSALFFKSRSDMTDEQWLALIDSNLLRKQPIYYDGSDQEGGHAFVLDGSNYDTTYHFNWGWAGYGDGYFAINNLAPLSGGIGTNPTNTFNYNQGAIFGIVPIPTVFDTVDYYDTICDNQTEYVFHEYTLTAKKQTIYLRHLDTIFNLHLAVRPVSNAIFNSNTGGLGKDVRVEFCDGSGFIAPECPFTFKHRFFVGWGRNQKDNTTLYQPGDTLYFKGTPLFYAQWQDSSTLGIPLMGDTDLPLYPNPTSSVVSIQLPDDESMILQMQVIDNVGRILIQQQNAPRNAQIDLKSIPSGIYTLHIETPYRIYNKRVIKQ